MGSMRARSSNAARRALCGAVPSFRGTSHHRRVAFTLVELVVVLVLIGIVSAAVMPAVWHAATPDSANVLAEPVVSLLRFAQRSAASQNQVVRVTIDPETNAYRAETMGDGVTRAEGTVELPSDARFLTDLDRLQVTFDPAGRADADSLVVRDAQRTAMVRVDPWTGTIDVQRQ